MSMEDMTIKEAIEFLSQHSDELLNGRLCATNCACGIQSNPERNSSKRLPTVEEMSGAYPDLTGDLTTKEYLDLIRGEDTEQ